MKYKILIIFLLSISLLSCEQNKNIKILQKNNIIEKKYRNSGFTLIYNDQLKTKKIDQRSLNIFHKTLKKKSFVKITNPINGKSLIAEVKSNRADFSSFYNSVITNRIAENLELDFKEPYINIVLISIDSTFIAKKSKTFDEEKNVAEKAPIDGIQISNLNAEDQKNISTKKNNTFSYSIKVADFYYKKTAKNMIDRIRSETSLDKLTITKLSKNDYRVLIGPFNDIKSLRESFEKMKSLYFENLEIIKND